MKTDKRYRAVLNFGEDFSIEFSVEGDPTDKNKISKIVHGVAVMLQSWNDGKFETIENELDLKEIFGLPEEGMPEFGNSERKQDALDKLIGKTSITPAYEALVIPKSSDDDTDVTYRKSRLVDSDSKLPIFLPV